MEFKKTKLSEAWPCYGIPATIVVDNGLDLTSKMVSDACMALGIEILYSPPREPWYKGVIERFGRTMNMKLIHWLPGTTLGKKDLDSYDYKPIDDASVLDDDLFGLFEKFITEIQNRTPRSGRIGSPLKRWEEGISIFPPRLPASMDEFDAAVALTIHPKLNKQGIQYQYINYNNEELGRLWNKLGEKKNVLVKVNPLDLTSVMVVDPITDIPFRVESTKTFNYPSTLDYHLATIQYAKANSLDPKNDEHLTQASMELQEMLAEASKRGKQAVRRAQAKLFAEANSFEKAMGNTAEKSTKKELIDDLDEMLGSLRD